MKQTKPIAYQQNVHVQDQSILIDFLNSNCKQIGVMENLWSFIDIVSINNDVGLLLKEDFLIIERGTLEDESTGNDQQLYSGPKERDIFDYPYNHFDDLPDSFPKEPITSHYGFYLTAKTHKCNPKMECNECEGTGKCADCEGRGKKSCTSCEGTGKKEVRDGRYGNGNPKYKKVTCLTCDGFKRVTCQTCHGSKRCNECVGEGEITCNRCNGTSYYQDVTYVQTTYKSSHTAKISKNLQDFVDVLSAAGGKTVFDDDLVEWEYASSILFDKRNDAIHQNKHFVEFSKTLNSDAGLTDSQRLVRVHAKLENTPITTIDYTFENKPYTLYIVGENNIVCHEEIPKQHAHRAGIFTRFTNLFTKKKRQLAFLYIAAYMFNSDGVLDKRELMLLDMLLKEVLPKPEERQQFISEFCRKLSFGEIEPHIQSVKNDPRAVVFAWQCVLQDRNIESSEVEAFNLLADFCKVDASNLEKLKQKAEKFGKLDNSQLIFEYFK